MIKEAIDRIVSLACPPIRPSVMKLDDGSGRQYLYDDKAWTYRELERFVPQTGAVSTVEAFAALVLEQARRRNKPDGSGMTVTFTTDGASFSPDDEDGRHRFTYSRRLAPGWAALTKALGAPLSHVEFVRLLQALRVHIDAGADVIRFFRKISAEASTKVQSQPLLEEGKAGSVFAVELEVKGGTARASLPSSLELTMPFTRGSGPKHRIHLELDVFMTEKKALALSVYWPEISVDTEKAVQAEIDWFNAETKALERLLRLVNF